MGVNKLFEVVDSKGNAFGSYGEHVQLKDMKGKNIIIDGNIMSYQCMTALTEETALRDSSGRITHHLKILLSKVLLFNKLGISQLWAFDNPELNPRKLETNKIRKSTNSKYKRFILTSEHYDEIKELLRCMGISYIIVPPGIEAEQYASWMTYSTENEGFDIEDPHKYHYVLSTDSDVLMFKGNMLRQYVTRTKKSTGGTKCDTNYATFEYDDFIEKADMNHEDLMKIATVMGHDFYPGGIKGTSVKTVYKKVKSGSVSLTLEQNEALEQFTLNPEDYYHMVEFIKDDYNPEKVKDMLLERDFNENTLNTQLNNFNTDLL